MSYEGGSPGEGTGIRKHKDGIYRTADGRFQVHGGYRGTSYKYRVKDTATGEVRKARTLLDARWEIRWMRDEKG